MVLPEGRYALKPVRYTDHLRERLVLRQIDQELPRRIIAAADRKEAKVFNDSSTRYRIAVATLDSLGDDRRMIVAYEETATEIIAVTIHPIPTR